MTRDINANLRAKQRIAREFIENIRVVNGPLAADCYVGGIMLAIAEYKTDWYGRLTAYEYFAGFADDLMFAESSDERLGRQTK